MSRNKRKGPGNHLPQPSKKQKLNQDAVGQLPKATVQLSAIPAFSLHHPVSKEALPALPAVKDEKLAATAFHHRSLSHSSGAADTSYERLEFLGDAYLELFASRLLFHRFAKDLPYDDFSRLLQIRESLVRNETLAGFAGSYAFHEMVKMAHKEDLSQEKDPDRKLYTKVMGDCFEAYVAAIVLDSTAGFDIAETWMASLWEPKIREFLCQYHFTISKRSEGLVDHHEKALEFLGGAYLELFATRLIFTRFNDLNAGRMSQLTEQLIKTQALATVAMLSNFPRTSYFDDKRNFKSLKDHHKALVIAYKAHIGKEVLRDEGQVSAIEDKMVGLWTPKLMEEIKNDATLNTILGSESAVQGPNVYDHEAKALLQRRLPTVPGVKVEYERYQDSVELKDKQLGQTRHFIACYLSGYGYTRRLLGKGEGKSKVEAGNWAAIDAMYGDSKSIVDECEAKRLEMKAKKSAGTAGEESQVEAGKE